MDRVELVQVPAQALLTAAAFVDEIVAVHDQELQLPVALLAGTRPVEVRLAQPNTGDGERIDRVFLAARKRPRTNGWRMETTARQRRLARLFHRARTHGGKRCDPLVQPDPGTRSPARGL
jgi:hypothetical protein